MLEIQGVSKTYGSLRALDSVSLTAVPGEIHAVLGENGAGKSTLMGVLSGFVLPDSGSVQLGGKDLALGRPFQIKQLGIEMVHQHFMLVPAFTVAENLAIYRLEKLFRMPNGPSYHSEAETSPGVDTTETLPRPKGPSSHSEGWSEPGEATAKAGERNPGKTRPSPLRRAEGPRFDSLQIAIELGWQINPNALARDLTVGAQQRVEILKALGGDARVIILDEPTAVLSPDEVEDLFRILRKLKESGKIVILIAHKLKEVMQIADRVTVLRKGQNVGSDAISNLNEQKLAEWMVGGMPPLLSKHAAQAQSGLTVTSLSVKGNLGQESVRGVSFTAGRGEILGIGGVDGNGQIELAEALAQIRAFAGEMLWHGHSISKHQRTKANNTYPTPDVNGGHTPAEFQAPTSEAAAPKGRGESSEGRSPGTGAEQLQSPERATFNATSGGAAPKGREALSEGRSPGIETGNVQSPEGATQGTDEQSQSEVEATCPGSPEGGENSIAPTLGYIPQDRQTDGLALGMSVKDNLLIQGHNKKELSVGPFLINKRITEWAQTLVQKFSIAVTNINEKAGSLSGGNQQKVVVARTLESEPELLIAVNPTRGLDIQATNYVHRQLLEAKQNGAAVVLFTTDLDELSQLADRTLFMSSGRFAEGVDAAALVGGSS